MIRRALLAMSMTLRDRPRRRGMQHTGGLTVARTHARADDGTVRGGAILRGSERRPERRAVAVFRGPRARRRSACPLPRPISAIERRDPPTPGSRR